MTERSFRNKIQWFIFVLGLLVIWMHSYNAELFLGNTQAGLRGQWIQEHIGEYLGQTAVPGFFLISAYLFFRGFRLRDLPSKWGSRIRSILLPYLLWNGIYYLGYVIGSRLPFMTDVVGKGVVPFRWKTALDAVLFYTYNYVFWYLQQLIFLILLAPVIYLALRYAFVAGACILALTIALHLGKAVPWLNLDALWYYSIGACAAIHGKKLTEGRWNIKRAAAGIAILAAAWLLKQEAVSGPVTAILGYRLLTPIGFWFLTPEEALFEAKPWMYCSFFFYASHFAIVRLINKTGATFLPPVPEIPMILFLAMPFLVVLIAYPSACWMRKRLPSLWNLLNGGRGG